MIKTIKKYFLGAMVELQQVDILQFGEGNLAIEYAFEMPQILEIMNGTILANPINLSNSSSTNSTSSSANKNKVLKKVKNFKKL